MRTRDVSPCMRRNMHRARRSLVTPKRISQERPPHRVPVATRHATKRSGSTQPHCAEEGSPEGSPPDAAARGGCESSSSTSPASSEPDAPTAVGDISALDVRPARVDSIEAIRRQLLAEAPPAWGASGGQRGEDPEADDDVLDAWRTGVITDEELLQAEMERAMQQQVAAFGAADEKRLRAEQQADDCALGAERHFAARVAALQRATDE